MKIGELAAQTGCDVQTVRYYEREGLLDKPEREASGYRRYAAKHMARLHFIRHCRSLNLPLSEIRQLIAFADTPRESCPEVNALLDEHIGQVQRRIAELTALETQLVALRRECPGAGDAASCAILAAFMSAAADHACACHRGNGDCPP